MKKIIVTREAIYVSVICTLLIFILGVEWTKLDIARDQLETYTKMYEKQLDIDIKLTNLINIVGVQQNDISNLYLADNKVFDELDTIKISFADLKNGYVNHEGRLVKLEEYHE